MKTDHVASLVADIKYKADRYIVLELKRHGIYDLVPSHGGILNALFNQGNLTMKQLARFIDRDKSTVTTLVNKLINLGYVSKEQDLKDKRVYNIQLTRKGKELKPVFDRISIDLINKFTAKIKKEQTIQLIQILEQIKTAW